MGFLSELLDVVAGFAEQAAKNGLRTSDRIQRKHGERMSKAQSDKMDRMRAAASSVEGWASRRNRDRG